MMNGNNSAYRRIVDRIAQRIIAGDLAPGDAIPSESALSQEWDVSPGPVRRAMAELKSRGLVVGRPGRGVFVAERPAAAVRTTPDRYWREHPRAAWLHEAETAGAAVDAEHRTVRVAADEAIAARLGRDVGDDVVETTYLIRMDGAPVSMSTSWEPAVLTDGTPVADPHAGPHADTGVVPRFDAIGWRAEEVREDITARMPTPDEVYTLALPGGVPVLEIEQKFWARSVVIEAARIILAANRYRLSHRGEIR